MTKIWNVLAVVSLGCASPDVDDNPYCEPAAIEFVSLESSLLGDWECMLSYVDEGVESICSFDADTLYVHRASACEVEHHGQWYNWSIEQGDLVLRNEGDPANAPPYEQRFTLIQQSPSKLMFSGDDGSAYFQIWGADCSTNCRPPE